MLRLPCAILDNRPLSRHNGGYESQAGFFQGIAGPDGRGVGAADYDLCRPGAGLAAGRHGDALGAAVLRYVALAAGVVWIVVLVGLIFVQAIQALGRSDDADQ